MTEVCQKALDRIEKRKVEERNYADCIKYRICPKCGGDLVSKVMIWVYLSCENEDCDFTFSG